MNIINLNWKSNILSQLKEQNCQQNGYQRLIETYNHILENNSNLQNQCFKLEKDVNHLRSINTDLEKKAESCEELEYIKNKLEKANEEVLTNLREKGEVSDMKLAREVLRLNHALNDLNEKFTKEEIKAQQYKTENDELHETLQSTEYHLNEVLQTNEILQEEFQALQNKIDQLQIDYNKVKPACLELEQQLETAQRINKQIEDELLVYKNQQAAMHDYENAKFLDKCQKKVEVQKQDEGNIFFDDDVVFIPSMKSSSDLYQDPCVNSTLFGDGYDQICNSYDESLNRERKSIAQGLSNGGGKLLTNLVRKFTNGMHNNSIDKLYRTSTNCSIASIPTRIKASWNCTDLEVYALQFQPSGSILATGCSDKMVHLWEISSIGQQEKYCSLQGSQGAINALDFDNEGCRILAGCSGDKAYIWSYGEQKTLKDTCTGHQGVIYTCKFISGTKLVTGSADRTIKIWDIYGRKCIQTLFAGSKCHDLVILDAAGTIISGHYDRKIRIWDPFANNCRTELQYDAAITSLSFNDEKRTLLACFKDDTLKLIDLRQNKTIYTFSHDNFKVSTDTHKAVLSPDARYACVGSHDGSLVVWNMENAQCENVLKQKHSTMVTSVAWQPDGKYVASCEKHRQTLVMEWKQKIYRQLQERNKQERDVYAEIVKHYNRLIENYSTLLIRCTDQERDILALRQENSDLQKNSVSLGSLPVNDKIRTLEHDYMKAKDEILTLLRERGDMTKEVISLSRIVKERDEKLYAEENKNQTLTKENTAVKQRLESAEDKLNALQRVNETIHDEFQALQLAYTQMEERQKESDATVAVLRREMTAKIEKKCDAYDQEVIAHDKKLEEDIKKKLDEARNDIMVTTQLKLSSSAVSFKSANMDGKIHLTPAIDSIKVIVPTKAIVKWDCGDNELHAIQFHPSGSLIASGGSDRKIHIWEFNSSNYHVQQVYTLAGNNSTVTAIDFDNENANLILGCSEDFACRVWGLTDQRLRHTLTGHGAKVFCAKFVTATLIASGSQDRTLKLWDLQNRQCVRTLFAGSKCHDLVAHDASGSLISGHFDKKIRFWDARNDSTKCELQLQAAVTSLSINRGNHEDFKVASDTVKAVLSPDCKYACAGGSDGSVFIWNIATGKIERVLNKEHSTIINAVAWHPEGRFIASCEKQRRAIIWGE
ncbi:unnamed protein product [Rotaria socialis]|uniref:Autophagy-related protein 16 domain-containing protein n=1 Tax=Rotaria socialis TaxID=392032 RepID=A0A820JWR8_9BILA|nr:unnamed protein product [Rotaria socialis]